MLKKISILSFVMFILMGAGNASAALRNGLYMGLSAGGSMMRAKIKGEMERDTAFVATLALGGRFRSVRIAGEIMMNTKADYENVSYEANGYSLQAYYDVPLRSIVRPFFNVGLGMYSSKIKGKPDIDDDKDNKIMWNVGGGLSFAVSRATSLDLGYRYVRFGKENYLDGNKKKVEIENESHQVYVGWRYVF